MADMQLSPDDAPEVMDESPDHLDEDNRLSREYVTNVREELDSGDFEAVRKLVEPLHNADIADLLEIFPEDHRGQLAIAIGDLLSADVVAELNDYVRDTIVDALGPSELAEITAQLETDDAVAIIEDLEADEQRAVLRELLPEDRAAIENALSYPEETAGRLMQRDLVAVPEHITVGQLIDFLREDGDLTTDFWEVFIVDAHHHPVGTCSLSWILRTPRDIPLADVMKRDQTLIPADMDQEEVALRFQKYALISAAVTDDSGRLVGVITADDILHIVNEEASEDALLLSGAGEGDINEPIRDTYKARVRWLVANLGTAAISSSIIALFGGAIESMVALAILMPIVASIGGNAGTQTMAVSVRAIAMNQLTDNNTKRIVLRELRVALLNGVTVACLVGIATFLVFSNLVLSLVIAAAIVFNVAIAGLAGVMVPVLLDRWDQDPAVASSVFVTMITDSMGFMIFLGLAVASGLVGV